MFTSKFDHFCQQISKMWEDAYVFRHHRVWIIHDSCVDNLTIFSFLVYGTFYHMVGGSQLDKKWQDIYCWYTKLVSDKLLVWMHIILVLFQSLLVIFGQIKTYSPWRIITLAAVSNCCLISIRPNQAASQLDHTVKSYERIY